jgi:hypothetical protein
VPYCSIPGLESMPTSQGIVYTRHAGDPASPAVHARAQNIPLADREFINFLCRYVVALSRHVPRNCRQARRALDSVTWRTARHGASQAACGRKASAIGCAALIKLLADPRCCGD